jgi:hypothetical protein
MKLLAIVNRPDLRIVHGQKAAQAGEGRLIFAVLDQSEENFGSALPTQAGRAATGLTFILEYALPARKAKDVERWAEDWAELSEYDLDSELEDYLDALEDVTRGLHSSMWGYR